MADDQWWFDLKTKTAVQDRKAGRNEAFDNDPRWNDDLDEKR